MKIDLSNQHILLTGASRGIGKAIAYALGEAGATLAIHYGSSKDAAEQIAKDIGNNSIAIQADLSQPADCRKLVVQTLEAFGKVDTLVNNAGIALESPIDGETNKWLWDWNQTLAVNLTASTLLIKELLPQFISNHRGKIINIASRASFRGDTPDYVAYAASKGGMVAMSRSIARAFGKQGIVSFVVAPGFTRTEMAEQFIEKYGEEYATSDIALGRLTLPEDIAPTIVFLSSGMMDHATGSTIDINAGSYVH